MKIIQTQKYRANIPPKLIIAGFDPDGYPLGVGRFRVIRDIIPGTFSTQEGCVRVCYGWFSFTKCENFEILCDGNVQWVPAEYGKIPHQSVSGGQTEYGERLYVFKCEYEGVTVIGKVHSSHRRLYFPWKERGLELEKHIGYLHLVDKKGN